MTCTCSRASPRQGIFPTSSNFCIYELFYKNLESYYLFNVVIQSVNTCLVAMLVNLFLRSPLLSLLTSLLYGLSRFSFFIVAQLFNGGILEGLAMTFFLLSLFFALKTIVEKDNTYIQVIRALAWSLVFANLSMYTHERYIVLFPFLMIVIFFFPRQHKLLGKKKIYFAAAAILSMLVNAGIKKYAYGMPFFVGTGGTNISFSFATAFSFLTDAVLSIFQLNSGPEYLIGIPFRSLKGFNLVLVLFVAASLVSILVAYLFHIRKVFANRHEDKKSAFYVFLLLGILFALCLAPAIVTIRLEQRWLQASFSVFIIMIIIAFNALPFRKEGIKYALLCTLLALTLWGNYNYLSQGVDNLYMKEAERTAALFVKGLNTKVIHPAGNRLYLWEKQRDVNAENGATWALGEGYIFNFYSVETKQIIFVDSIYHQTASGVVSSFPAFNKDRAQILYVRHDLVDITELYLKDSLKNFSY